MRRPQIAVYHPKVYSGKLGRPEISEVVAGIKLNELKGMFARMVIGHFDPDLFSERSLILLLNTVINPIQRNFQLAISFRQSLQVHRI